MYKCSTCEKEYLNRHQFMGHCGSHSRKGATKKSVTYSCLHCQKENTLSHLKPSASVPRFCDKICWRAFQVAERESRLVKWGDGTVGDITLGELAALKASTKFCEICGCKEVGSSSAISSQPNMLSADHDHKTNKFRGLLCIKCNIQLGWYEKHKDGVDSYLAKNVAPKE